MSRSNTDDPAAEARRDAERSAERLSQDARQAARDLGQRAQHKAEAQAERAKSGVASEMSGVASALRKAAEDMRAGSPQERTFSQIADSLADASEAVRERDLGELATEASGFARRNPLAFLGGAALAGFAITRFAKASQRRPQESRADAAPAMGHDLPQATKPRPGDLGPNRRDV